MKKIIILALFFLGIKTVDAQDNPVKIPIKATLSGTITKVNFHKPRTNCESGFGFCVKGTLNFTVTANQRVAPPTYIKGDTIAVYGIRTATTFELHVPSALKQIAGNETLDFSNFTLEDGNSIAYVEKGKTTMARLRGGTYPVKQLNSDYVITVNIE